MVPRRRHKCRRGTHECARHMKQACDLVYSRRGGSDPRRLLWTPSHLYSHRHFVLNSDRQERRWVDLEISERSWNCP